MKILLPLVLVLILVGLVIYFAQNLQSIKPQEPLAEQLISGKNPSHSPDPILFEELTIPYLRSKTYESRLGEISEYAKTGSYTSYLTSYISDGLKINGLLTKPNGEIPDNGWPAIIFVHGYIPPASYKTTEKYADHVNFLAGNGFVVFKIDLRGHGNSEGEAGGGYYSEGYVVDTLNAYSALQNSGFVNPEKIGLWGHSMAGNITLRAFAAKPDIPAVVIWAGAGFTYIDLAEYKISNGSYRPPANNTERQRKRQLLRETYGEPNGGNSFWNLVAPTNYLIDLKGAIQLNHAINDDVVSVEYSRNLNNLLDQTSVPHELNEYASGGHNISSPSFIPAMQNTVNFFKKYLTK